jgi:hypothetical protein
MRLPVPLCKLPLRFDVGRLTQELETFGPDDWENHPNGHKGSSNIILISAHGEVNDDFAASGQMRATAALKRCPYLRDVMAAFQSPIARARLTRLAGSARLTPHEDANFHWFSRVRVHVPIVTNPAVRFHCGDRVVHMAPGEAWLFDNFREHSVCNDALEARVHLIFDTQGSAWFWALVDKTLRRPQSTRPIFVAFGRGAHKYPATERHVFSVPQPSEVAPLVADVIAALPAAYAGVPPEVRSAVRRRLRSFEDSWRGTFAEFGQDADGAAHYQAHVESLLEFSLRSRLRERLDRYSRGYGSLAVLLTIFQTTNRTVPQARSVPAAPDHGPAADRAMAQ